MTIWATGVLGGEDGARPGAGGPEDRAGLTVSSMLVADGEPGRILGLIDEDSALWDALSNRETFAVSVLGAGQGNIADVFAGLGPSPGGPFRAGTWIDSEWGPVLEPNAGWIGARLAQEPRHTGWALMVEAVIEHLDVGDGEALTHTRGRYH